ncbi:MAG: hypothetical protein GXP17_08170 [Gammaproteobacteria bacterium]|nr:hypothetical protein [Gammaproteobacteria bacterium]
MNDLALRYNIKKICLLTKLSLRLNVTNSTTHPVSVGWALPTNYTQSKSQWWAMPTPHQEAEFSLEASKKMPLTIGCMIWHRICSMNNDVQDGSQSAYLYQIDCCIRNTLPTRESKGEPAVAMAFLCST